jgi:hypothetical protein
MTQPELNFDTPQATGQCADVLDYISDYGSITSWEAIMELGITRLGSRLDDLKNMGYRFDGVTESRINKKGKKIHYKRYRRAV